MKYTRKTLIRERKKNTTPKILKIRKARIVVSRHPNIEKFEHNSF
jgi:hypothetical protein